MTTSTKINIKKEISVDLSLRHSANTFFDYIESLEDKELIIDFKGIKSISRSFAHQYMLRKQESDKIIKETNVLEDVQKMFSVIKQPRKKTPMFDSKAIREN